MSLSIVGRSGPHSGSGASQQAGATNEGPGAAAGLPARREQAAVKFEAMLLQGFVEAMLPAEGHGLFGNGTAGGMWRSLLAEHIAQQIARGGTLGIADRIVQPGSALARASAGESGKP